MKADRFARLKDLLIRAKDLPENERRIYLEAACKDDPDLRREAESLLAHSSRPDEILEAGALIPHPTPAPESRTAATRPATSLSPQKIAGYRIIRKLGEGGMGIVYEARQENPRRKVALKAMRPDVVGPSALKRFQLEVQVLGQLNHPGIGQVYEAGTAEDGQPYFVMEYVPGRPLLDYVDDRRPPVRERLELMAQICDAVHYAHEKGVIHRDLKPANILVAQSEESHPKAKILDFGVARAAQSGLDAVSAYTRTGQLVGTLAYMSPEQVAGRPEDIDVRSDVYQLGVILYVLLTGRHPYEVEDLPVAEAARVIAEREPQSLGSLDTRYRRDVEKIVGKALEKDRERRYSSAAELGEDIRRSLRGDPITARPPSAVHRLRLLGRRHRILSQVTLIVVLAVLLGLVFPRISEWLPGSPAEKPSLAVLFFRNLGLSKEDDYFAAGVTEDVITKLSQIRQLNVLSRSAVERYRDTDVDPKDVGRQLKVGYVLEGSVRREDPDLRITVQLIDTASGFHTWARTFSGRIEDIFAMQDSVATHLADALGVTIEPDEVSLVSRRWTENAEAYAYFLTGREELWPWYRPERSAEARPWFEKALALDPDYAPALAGLSHVLAVDWRDLTRRPGQLERALQLARRAKDLDPTLPDAWTAEAKALYLLGDHEQAVNLLRSVTKMAPRHRQAYSSLGKILLERGDYNAAIDNSLLARQHVDDYGVGRLVDAYRALGRFDEANAALAAAMERRPKDPRLTLKKAGLLHDQGRQAESIQLLRTTVIEHPDYYWARRVLARRLQSRGEPAEADSVFQEILRRWPNSAMAWNRAGQLSLGQSSFEAAEHRFLRAIEIEPYDYFSWRDLGRCAIARGDTVEAERILQKRMEMWPDDPGVFGDLARFHEQAKRYEVAEEAHKERISRWPNNLNVAIDFAQFCGRRSKHDVAERWARKALTIDPQSELAYRQIGWECWHQGRFEEAIDWFEKAAEMTPMSYDAHFGVCRSLEYDGRFEEAVDVAQRFVDRAPGDAQGWHLLGYCQHSAGELFQAAAAYERALSLGPDRPLTLNGLAMIYRSMGRYEKALEMFQRAAAVDSTSWMAWHSIATLALYSLVDDSLAEDASRHAIALARQPWEAAASYEALAIAENRLGQTEEAHAHLSTALALIEEALVVTPYDLRLVGPAMTIYARSGDAAKTRDLTDRVMEQWSADPEAGIGAASARAIIGDTDAAFEYLTVAIEAGYFNKEHLRSDPDFASIRDDPRFEELLASIR